MKKQDCKISTCGRGRMNKRDEGEGIRLMAFIHKIEQ
jgi:hypothetical protein